MKINGKVKKYLFKSGKYLREVSVVIIGVAITFIATDYINKRKEKKEIQQNLKLIHTELENNLKSVKTICNFFEDFQTLNNMLNTWAKNPEKINQDSLNQYMYIVYSDFAFTYKQAAYNMFINSGVMRNMNQSNLLLDITECYLELETLRKECDTYIDLRNQEWSKVYSILEKNESFSIFDSRYKNLFNFHSWHGSGIKVAHKTKEIIEKTLSEIMLVKK